MRLIAVLLIFSFLSTDLLGQDTVVLPDIKRRERKDINVLVQKLTGEDTNQLANLTKISYWISSNIRYDINTYLKGQNPQISNKKVLKKRKGMCRQYSNLFLEMCNIAGIEAYDIIGYTKGMGYVEGDHFFITDHVWNAARIDGEWYVFDLTWASGHVEYKISKFKRFLNKLFGKPLHYYKPKFKAEVNPQYLYAAHDFMLQHHLPYDPMWQFTNDKISIDTFESKTQCETIEVGNYAIDPDLNTWLRLSDDDKILSSARRSFNYNDKNHIDLAISLTEYADYQVEIRDIAFYDTVKAYYKEAIKNAQKAATDASLFKRNRRTELRARNKEVKDLNRVVMSKTRGALNTTRSKIALMKSRAGAANRAIANLQKQSGKLDEEDVSLVKRPKEERKYAASSILDLEQKIASTEAVIDSLLIVSNQLNQQNDSILNIIVTLYQEYEPVNMRHVLMTDVNVLLQFYQAPKCYFHPWHDSAALLFDSAQIILSAGKVLVKDLRSRESAKDKLDRKILSLYKLNKTSLKQMIRLSVSDRNEVNRINEIITEMKRVYLSRHEQHIRKIILAEELMLFYDENREIQKQHFDLLVRERNLENAYYHGHNKQAMQQWSGVIAQMRTLIDYCQDNLRYYNSRRNELKIELRKSNNVVSNNK